MKKFLFMLGIALQSAVYLHAQQIVANADGKSWLIKMGADAAYSVLVNAKGEVQTTYFGSAVGAENIIGGALGAETPVRGAYNNTTPLLEAIFPDGVRDVELVFKSAEIIDYEGRQTLKITQSDKYYPLELQSFIRALDGYGMIEKWNTAVNTGKKGVVRLENLQSGSVFLPKDAYQLTHYSGVWGNEFRPFTSKLTPGVKTLQIKDFNSYGSSTFIVQPENEPYKAWFGTVAYSGNWRVDFEKFFNGAVQICGGINFWDTEINLQPGKSFTTPRILFGYTDEGIDGVTQRLTSFVREQLLPAKHRDLCRPVIYNSWYATTFNVNEPQQLELAKIAKDIGVEMFVIDDGWFRGRVNDQAGLGDWTVDTAKFPEGLQPMIRKINDLGLDFGIWIEPEMVNPNSGLYRAHPDWAFNYPNRERHQGRNQLMLNLAREDVCDYLYRSFHKLLSENNIKFIKWDMNKSLTDAGFASAPAEQQRAVRIRYVENLYNLVSRLRSDFPDVWFENCSSGGGRIDFGMERLFDFNWASDNTDPVERVFIQDAYLTLFPANTMISWVTHEDWHKQNHPLEFKFDVCMSGVLGVGNDLTKWNEGQKATAREKIALYKEIRETTHKGDLFRIVSPYESNTSILQFVSKDRRKAVIFRYNLAEYPNNATAETERSATVRLKGLLPDLKYTIEGIKGSFSGAYLMNTGVALPLKGAFTSKIYKAVATL